MTQQRLKTQVLVIGAGISGSTSALTLADAGYEVTLIVPGKELDGGNSALAQGGIVYRSDPNDAKDLEKDILIAGHHHNYVKAVRHLCQHGPEAVERILMERAPIPFDRLDGKLDFTREGGHGKHRIVHCADHTGKTIMEGLLQAVRMSPNIRILTGRTAVDLITTDHHARYKEYRYQLDNQCLGAYVYNEDTREVETLLADFTVLATGGVGQVYLHTTNTAACTGSGIAMAQRAGVRLDTLEYVQFHPTALYTRQSHSFLITEAMRGEGARLTNAKGEFFMKRYDERADLAPRDIVARAIMDEMLHSGEPCMYLDVSGVKHDIPTRFPTIYQHCMELGIDINKKPIPVVPVAHFFCGGILVDASARTTLTRLYSVGECSCTGLHGANRLASTSLLEALLWGYSAGQDIAQRITKRGYISKRLADAIPDWEAPATSATTTRRSSRRTGRPSAIPCGTMWASAARPAACTVPLTTCAPFPAISTTSTKIRPSPSLSWIFSTAARRPTASPRAPCATPAASGAITGSTRAERIAGRGNLFFREIPLPRACLWGPRLPFPKAAVFVEEPHAPSPRLAIGLGYDRLPKRAQTKASKEERSEKSFIRTVLPLPCFLRFL